MVKNNLDSKLSSKIASRKASLIETSRFLSKQGISTRSRAPLDTASEIPRSHFALFAHSMAQR